MCQHAWTCTGLIQPRLHSGPSVPISHHHAHDAASPGRWELAFLCHATPSGPSPRLDFATHSAPRRSSTSKSPSPPAGRRARPAPFTLTTCSPRLPTPPSSACPSGHTTWASFVQALGAQRAGSSGSRCGCGTARGRRYFPRRCQRCAWGSRWGLEAPFAGRQPAWVGPLCSAHAQALGRFSWGRASFLRLLYACGLSVSILDIFFVTE